MAKQKKLQLAARKITSLFSKGDTRSTAQKKHNKNPHFMRLNFMLLSSFLKGEKEATEGTPLFTASLLSSKNKHLAEMTKQANSCCSNHDLHLFSHKQFYHRNEFAMHRVIEWKLSKYIKNKARLAAIIHRMQETPPDAFKRHLVNLLSKNESAPKEEPLDKEEKWKVWQSQGGGTRPFSIAPP